MNVLHTQTKAKYSDMRWNVIKQSEYDDERQNRVLTLQANNKTPTPSAIVKFMWIRCIQNDKQKFIKCVEWIVVNGSKELTEFIKRLDEKSEQFAHERRELIPWISSDILDFALKANRICTDLQSKIGTIKGMVSSVCQDLFIQVPEGF